MKQEEFMKKLLVILAVAIMLIATSGIAFADSNGPMGPAPNSGDCVPDGSGFDSPNGPNADVGSGSGPVGPAPNSGDGIPDGSGF
jgi:hypothetical protein